MKKPMVSIITPSYNQGKYIEKTIESVINQTYSNIEYIILDSCSKDETGQILKKYRDYENIKIIIERDNGQVDAINKGFKMAKGELLGWINSDDLLDSKCIENIVDEYMKKPQAVIFYGELEFINDDGNKLFLKKIKDVNYDYLLNVNPDVNQPGSFYNKKYIEKIGYLDENLNFTMDYDLWLRLLCVGEAVNLNKVVAKFRIQLNSKTMTSGNGIKFWKDIFRVRKLKHSSNIKKISKFNIRFLKWCLFALIKKCGVNLQFK